MVEQTVLSVDLAHEAVNELLNKRTLQHQFVAKP